MIVTISSAEAGSAFSSAAYRSPAAAASIVAAVPFALAAARPLEVASSHSSSQTTRLQRKTCVLGRALTSGWQGGRLLHATAKEEVTVFQQTKCQLLVSVSQSC